MTWIFLGCRARQVKAPPVVRIRPSRHESVAPCHQRLSHIANLGLIYAGVYLLFAQLHGYQHDRNPDSFRFPAQEHRHAHEDMDIDNSTDESRNTIK